MTRTGAPPAVARRDLIDRLSHAAPVTLVAAPPGSGKTVLLREWAAQAAPGRAPAWVTVERDEHDAQRFWHAVVGALRDTLGDRVFVERLDAAPAFDGLAVADRVCGELRALEDPAVLVLDDVHEIRSADVLAQVEHLLSHRPPMLRVVLASRHDPRVGLHRLRLAGDLTEIRGADLRFTEDDTRELLRQTGVALSDDGVALAHARTEGWAAGLRLLALSLAGADDPERFVVEFSGSERTVAEYLVAEVLERQSDEVRRVLLRTSVVDRVNGPLAALLSDVPAAEAVLRDLERANAFVSAVDAGGTWFRYHALFGDLLRLELRRTDAGAVEGLHRSAAGWFAEHGDVPAAVRHARAAGDWALVADLLQDHSLRLALDGHGASIDAVLDGVPQDVLVRHPELARVSGGHAAWVGSAEAADRFLTLAADHADAVAPERRAREAVMVALARLALARRRGDVHAARAEADAVLGGDAAGAGGDARAVALMLVGSTELMGGDARVAERHLSEALDMARQAGRPWLEVLCLGHLALASTRMSLSRARGLALECVAAADAHGWGRDRVVGAAVAALAVTDVWQADLDAAGEWLARSEAALGAGVEPALVSTLAVTRGMLLAGRGDHGGAVAAFRAATATQRGLAGAPFLAVPARQLLVHSLIASGDLAGAQRELDSVPPADRDSPPILTARAVVALAAGDPPGALALLDAALDGGDAVPPPALVQAHLHRAGVRDGLGDGGGAQADVEAALAAAETHGLLWPFLVAPVGHLVERHPRHGTAHGALLQEIAGLAAGAPRPSPVPDRQDLATPLSDGELRVLRLLPTNLSAPEIGAELFLSANTVKTHMRRIYGKLGVHRRTDAVDRARAAGLLSPQARRR